MENQNRAAMGLVFLDNREYSLKKSFSNGKFAERFPWKRFGIIFMPESAKFARKRERKVEKYGRPV